MRPKSNGEYVNMNYEILCGTQLYIRHSSKGGCTDLKFEENCADWRSEGVPYQTATPATRTFSSHGTRCQNHFKGRTFEMLRSSDGGRRGSVVP